MVKKNKRKGKGVEKTALKTDKKLAAKQRKLLEKLGEIDITEVVATLEAEERQRQTITEEICVTPPSPRSSFTLVTHPEKEELILFGGEFFNGQRICIYSDLFIYNIHKNEWKQIRSPAGPTPRSGHQMVAVASDGGQLWLFGGEYASPSQVQYYHYKDLWMMSLRTLKWTKIEATNGPSARSGHRMVASKKKLFIFGGFHDNNQSYRYFNDIHIFSLETYTWLQVQISGIIKPPARSGCCMAATPEGKILIWGGYSKSSVKKDIDRGITHTDMYSLVLDKSNADQNAYKWITIKPSGYKPLPRSSVSCTYMSNGKAYCFGGVMDINENEECLFGQFGNELLSFDLTNLIWRLLDTSSQNKLDTNATSQTTTAFENNDVEMNKADEDQQTKITVVSDNIFSMTITESSTSHKMPSLFSYKPCKDTPTPRMNAGLCICKGSLYLYGGIFEEENKQYTYNDLYTLDLHRINNGWKAIIPNDRNAHEWVDSDSESNSENEKSESSSESNSDTDTNSEMDTE